MSSKPIEKRDFPKYKMGFKRARSKEFKMHMPNFSKIVEEGSLSFGRFGEDVEVGIDLPQDFCPIH